MEVVEGNSNTSKNYLDANLQKKKSHFLFSVYLLVACWRLVLRMSQSRASSPKETVLLGEGGWTTGSAVEGAGEAPVGSGGEGSYVCISGEGVQGPWERGWVLSPVLSPP